MAAEHEKRAHALLSASGAGRWMNCTPSARLEEEYGENETSVYAREGTIAHEISELFIRKDILHNICLQDFESRLDELMNDELYRDEMLDYVGFYTDYCAGQYQEALSRNRYTVMEIEQRLDLRAFVKESFGTADCVVISDGLMEVIDLKYGKGVAVEAEWNKQLMLYGLGALRKYDAEYDIEEVMLTIVQPRLDNVSSWRISAKELYQWAEKELKPKAELAYEGKGELQSGEWCRFCSVKSRCRRLYDDQMEIAKYEFNDPVLLSDEEISDIVLRAKKFTEWVGAIVEYAQSKSVKDGKQWPRLKLVEGISRRKWADEEKAAEDILSRCPTLSPDEVFIMKVKPITAIEKLVGKKDFAEKLSDIVVRPQGNPTLVPDSDKRPAMGVSQAIQDFK